MEPKSLLIEAAQIVELIAATEDAGIQLTRFVDFIQHHNPAIDRTTATLTAAFCIHNLPTLFLDHPEMIEQLSAIADHNFRPTFGDLAKVGVGRYLGQLLPKIGKRSGDSW